MLEYIGFKGENIITSTIIIESKIRLVVFLGFNQLYSLVIHNF